MKRGAVALRSLSALVASVVGLEGAFLLVGTACLTAAASYVSPAAALAVFGIVTTITGIALVRFPRSS
jgi:hypothetical protein